MSNFLRIGGNLIDLSDPKVMTIINVTLDSFYAGSRLNTKDSLLQAVDLAVSQGTAIIDIGGCSTRPGSIPVDENEEYHRVRNAVSIIRYSYPEFPISIDTYRSSVVEKIADEFGPFLVNDISGGFDRRMFNVVAQYGLSYVLCYMKGNPQFWSDNISSRSQEKHFFNEKIKELITCGVSGKYDIIVDPNFGFVSDINENFKIINNLNQLSFEYPCVLAGVSRKSFICKTAGCTTESSLAATSAIHMALLERGVKILRVHDTAEAIQTIKLYKAIKSC